MVSVNLALGCWLDDRLLVRCLRAAEHSRVHERYASILLSWVVTLSIP